MDKKFSQKLTQTLEMAVNTNPRPQYDISIHTFTYVYSCNYLTYTRAADQIAKYAKINNCSFYLETYTNQRESLTIQSRTTHVLRKDGINKITLQKFQTASCTTCKYRILLMVNPRHLLGYKDHIFTEIVEPDKLPLVLDAMNFVLKKINPAFPDIIHEGHFCRIDYCTNFWFESQEIANEYMKILKKARIPSKFSLEETYSPTQHRKIPNMDDVTIQCKSYELSIYLKQKQMISRKDDYNYPNDEINHAAGQLRIELRTGRPKLYYLKHSNECEEPELITMPSELALHTILKQLKHMYGSGDFYRYSKARSIILESDYTQKVKEKLIDILDTVNKKRSLDTQKNGLDPDYLKKYLKYFNRLALSPITLPEKSINEFYPNPMRYIIRNTDVYQKNQTANYPLRLGM